MDQVSTDDLRRLRLHAQRLASQSMLGVAELVGHLLGIQAQEPESARLALRARHATLVDADIRHARETERSIVLTWAWRGTMHFVATADLPWLLPFLGPIFIRKTERRYQQLGLDASLRARATTAIQEVLAAHGPLTRSAIAAHLEGYPVAGQAIHHLVRYAALEGAICFGPERDGHLTYVPLADWVPDVPDRAVDLGLLARRYLEAYGPTSPTDLASWAGITRKQARTAFQHIADELIEVDYQGETLWVVKRELVNRQPTVCLLPGYDPYLLGYQDRQFMVDDQYAKQIHPGGGLIRPVVLLDGRAIGVWKGEPSRRNIQSIVVLPFETLSAEVSAAIELEVAAMGHFLARDLQWRPGDALVK